MNNKGFVMIETIIVVTILSIGLISLYSSYNLILSKASTKSYYDNAEHVYKSYFVGKYLEENNYLNFSGNFKDVLIDNDLINIADAFDIDKIYLAKGSYSNITSKNFLLQLDGSTINYINNMDGYDEAKVNIIVKYIERNEDEVLNYTYFATVAL
ncbi:MAG: prepilin-type N-terminal cleavage/methylation domain-containing protein [Bacilli bacterium]|nr:prepilin-type N-terminal cleavage/methylation domain-containing protein [Bacilli bacterium]